MAVVLGSVNDCRGQLLPADGSALVPSLPCALCQKEAREKPIPRPLVNLKWILNTHMYIKTFLTRKSSGGHQAKNYYMYNIYSNSRHSLYVRT
jgi:hypothetical protein